MLRSRTIAGSLAKRFSVAAAALATAALLLITASSWWLVRHQHAEAERALHWKEAEFHATTISRILQNVSSRLESVAGSTILATGLVDSAGKETYLTPFLSGIRQVGGIPVQILFTDFEGKEIASNGRAFFDAAQRAWLARQLREGKPASAIFVGTSGPELVAVELMDYRRTQTAEGALLYKLLLRDIEPAALARLTWNGAPPLPPATADIDRIVLPVETPTIFDRLGLQLIEEERRGAMTSLAPQYAAILVIAFILATGVFIIGSRLALSLTRDLRKLEHFAGDVMSKDFGVRRAEVGGSTEVANLARSINHMLDRLYEQHALLQQETQKFLQLANTIPNLAWMANPDGWIHWYNDRWYEYTGATPEQMEGWGWQSVHDPAVLPQVMASWKASITTGQPFTTSFPLRGADGVFHTFFTRALPLRDAAGRIMQWFGTNTDVTPLEQVERALRDSRERLKDGMIAARMVVWDCELSSGRVEFSENAQAVFGGSWSDIDSVWQGLHPDDRGLLLQARERALAERSQYHEVVRVIRPDNGGTVWLEVRGTVQCNSAGMPYAIRGVAIDITERKRAEEELRDADRRKDDFLAMLAHELRNPLAPISTAAQLLKLSRHDSAKVLQTSDIIARQVDHMTSLVDDLLDVSRVTRGLVKLDQAPLDLRDIVTDAVEQARPLLDARRHHFAMQLPAVMPWVRGDRKRLVQVLANLLNNAAKYTPEGGHVCLQVTSGDGQVVLYVIDDGIGIDRKILPHVFDLFTQAERSSDRSQGGLGLGLALVRSLVSLHGGNVSAVSAGPGAGATFAISLPCLATPDALPAPRAPGGAMPPPEPMPARRLRLMLVDDNRDAADSLALFLEAAGHEVLVDYAAHSALDRAAAVAPDVFLLDIGLPGMDGNELARCLRASPQTSGAAFIAITGYGRQFDQQSALAAGFDHYFVKPADTARLIDLLAALGARPSSSGAVPTH